MGQWKERWHWITSVFLCGCAVVFGTLLYPLVLLFFTLIALVYPLIRRDSSMKPTSRGAPPERSEA